MIIHKIIQKILYPDSHTDFFNVKSSSNDQFTTSKEKRYKTIQNITKLLVSTTDFEEMAQKVVDIMVQQMDYLGGILFLPDKEKKLLIPWTTSNSPLVKQALKLLPKKLREYSQRYDLETNNLIAKTFNENRVYSSGYYPDFISPAVPVTQARLIQKMTGTKKTIAYPVSYKSEILGVVMFVSDKEEIIQEEMEMLETFSELIGISINNTRQISDLKEHTRILEIKNRDLTSLYNLATKISQTLDPKMVAQNAVDSLPQNKSMIGAVLGRYDEFKKDITVIATSRNQLSYQVEKLIGDFSQYKVSLEDPKHNNSLSAKVIRTRQPHYTSKLEEYLSPPVPKHFVGVISNILQIKSIAAYPVISRGRCIGVLAYFLKEKDFTELEDNEKQLLVTYTNQIAIALDNANLYSASQEIQRNLEKALAQLESIRRHERDMIDIMGHELRTPISIARNALVMMDMQMKTNEQQPVSNIKKYVDMALDSTRREVSLIETLLSATKTDGKGFQLLLEKVNLVDVVNESLKGYGEDASKKGLNVIFEPPIEPILIYGDKTRIQEIADNFVSNAVKYTLKGNIEIFISKDEKYGYMAVKDSGIGISEEDLKRLGEKFFRARQYIDEQIKESGRDLEELEVVRPGGTGLGLYVTFNLIKIMDGVLDIKSKVKEGSTFKFGIPLYDGQPVKQIEKKTEEND